MGGGPTDATQGKTPELKYMDTPSRLARDIEPTDKARIEAAVQATPPPTAYLPAELTISNLSIEGNCPDTGYANHTDITFEVMHYDEASPTRQARSRYHLECRDDECTVTREEEWLLARVFNDTSGVCDIVRAACADFPICYERDPAWFPVWGAQSVHTIDIE